LRQAIRICIVLAGALAIFPDTFFPFTGTIASLALRDVHKRLLILIYLEIRMNATRTLLAISLATFSLPGLSDDAPAGQTQSPAAVPTNTAEWVAYLSDFTRNGELLADPKKFVAALHTVSEPEFLIAATKAMMDPNLYLQSTASLMDPRAYGNFAKAMDPVVMANWTQALMDPQFLSAVTTVVTDPNKLMRWAMAPMDPRALGLLLNTLNPNTYVKFAGAAVDPRMTSLATAPLNPNWYGAWLGNMANPQAYGPTFNAMMRAPGYPAAQPMAPVYPQAIPSFPMIDLRFLGVQPPPATR
jgi:hypothetical protein